MHVYHGGGSQRVPYLVYYEGEINEFEREPKKLSVDNILEIILLHGLFRENDQNYSF